MTVGLFFAIVLVVAGIALAMAIIIPIVIFIANKMMDFLEKL